MKIFKIYRNLSLSEKKYLYLLSLIWMIGYVSTIWRRLGVENVHINNIILLSFLTFQCSKYYKNRIAFADLLIYLSLCFIYMLMYIIYPKTEFYLDLYAAEVLLGAFPFFMIGKILDISSWKFWINTISCVIVIINVFFILLNSNSGMESPDEQMNRAYMLLPSVLFLFWQVLEKFNLINIIFACVGLVVICSMGSRGPLVCFLFFIISYLFFFRKYKNKWLVRIQLLFLATIIYIFSEEIAYFMISLLSKLGLSTRIFDKMLQGALINYQESSSRDYIHGLLISSLNSNSQDIGYGLFSDRIYTGGMYSHNILIECWYSFGYIGGTLFFGILLLFILRYFIMEENRDAKIFALLLFTCSFIKLMFSGTFICDSFFFMIIGYSSVFRKKKELRVNVQF